MIPVSKFSSRGGERSRLVVLHTAEGARDVYSLGAFLQRTPNQVSYHGAVDDRRYESYVNYSQAAWSLRNGNQESDNLCLCAFAGWTRGEWLRHPRMLELTAAWIAERCKARGVPIRRLTDPECAAAIRDDHHPGGVIDHWTYTRATRDGSHWDVGNGFPWDVVMGRAQQIGRVAPAPPGGIEDMALDTEFVDWNGRKQTVFSWMMNVDKRLATGYGDVPPGDRHWGRRVDIGYMRDQIRGDVSDLRAEFEQRMAAMEAGFAAKLDAVLEVVGGPKA